MILSPPANMKATAEEYPADQSSRLTIEHVTKIYNPKTPQNKAVDDFNLTIHPGDFVTLLGPSGCGKTTTLRMIAGFEQPTAGEISLDGKSLLAMPPNRRPMSMVFQSYALFPHLTVRENVEFGLKMKKIERAERTMRVQAVLEMMGIEQYFSRYPHELSGGQQQRVALARALVMEPRILLFDEPLSNLDARLRGRMREEIRAIQQRLGITSIFVTHDQSEALTMSDVIVVMKDGQIEQVGTPTEVYQQPATQFVASFLGTANFLEAVVTAVAEESVTVDLGGHVVKVRSGTELKVGNTVVLVARSESIRWEKATEPRGALGGTIDTFAFDGAITRYVVETSQGKIQVDAPGGQAIIAKGTPVRCLIEQNDLWVVP